MLLPSVNVVAKQEWTQGQEKAPAPAHPAHPLLCSADVEERQEQTDFVLSYLFIIIISITNLTM